MQGKCAITKTILEKDNIHCHHVIFRVERIERKSSKKAVGASNKFKGRKKMSLANDYKGVSDRVTVIAATAGNKTDKIRVAAYCRVSTDKTDQVNSFLTQMRYYTDYIKSNPKMILIDIYADEEIIYGEQ